ncbi:hypothetical protein OGAPHI_002187 [Ogataea philodendri]|uniref:Ribosome biogenesis protein ALB1 n=1 Tax=Ogataea philodendri TaxID=1378263 RepID=A0A9P8T6T1_9ASCO|nr:uncharacterized protein OGAPHI_002187 [Ogataea philodendri]KAH3668433.1 hypothetical protein OGAPHI_002187 [Ogataea philodendri]
MPSRNSINKPKDNIQRRQKSRSLGRQRAGARNSTRVVAPKSTALALYNGTASKGGITTNTLSNKRSKKIERNKKYAKARNLDTAQLLADVQSKQEQMEVDEAVVKSQETVRSALWAVVEDVANHGFKYLAAGEGTTLGGPINTIGFVESGNLIPNSNNLENTSAKSFIHFSSSLAYNSTYSLNLESVFNAISVGSIMRDLVLESVYCLGPFQSLTFQSSSSNNLKKSLVTIVGENVQGPSNPEALV